MQKSFYDNLARPLKENEVLLQRVTQANRVVTWLFYFVYLLLLLGRILHWDVRFWHVLLVPAVSFALVTIVRRAVNAPRPYEVWNEPPLIEKDTVGLSCPSRHVFSAVMISMTALWLGFLRIGVLLLTGSAFLAVIRVATHIHFLRDVIAGAACGVGLALIGFYIF